MGFESRDIEASEVIATSQGVTVLAVAVRQYDGKHKCYVMGYPAHMDDAAAAARVAAYGNKQPAAVGDIYFPRLAGTFTI